MRHIGKNIRQLRQQRQLTQEELAQKLFVTRQTVSNYETGKSRPDVDMICQIAQVLQVDANAVIYGSPVEQERQARRRFGIVTGILVLLAGALLVLYPWAQELRHYRYLLSPYVAVELILAPVTALTGGWWLLQGVSLVTKARPLTKPWCRRARRLLLGLLVICFGCLLPEICFWIYGDILWASGEAYSISLPHIPVISDVMYGLQFVPAPVYALVGGLLWLLGFGAVEH